MQSNKGFTLIELLVTLAVASVLASIAVPTMRKVQANMRVNAVANDLVATLKLARSEAVAARRDVVVTAVNPGNWANGGWRVTEQIAPLPQPAKLVALYATVPATTTIRITPGLGSFKFEGITGMTRPALTTDFLVPGVGLTFRVCDIKSNQEQGRDIIVSPFGRILIKTHPTSALCNT